MLYKLALDQEVFWVITIIFNRTKVIRETLLPTTSEFITCHTNIFDSLKRASYHR